jgi:hypothetical protein
LANVAASVLLLAWGGRRRTRIVVSEERPIITPLEAPGAARTLDLPVTGADVRTRPFSRESLGRASGGAQGPGSPSTPIYEAQSVLPRRSHSINVCMEDTVNNEALGGSTYTLDSEDLAGEVNLLVRLMAEASEFLEQGDVKAARMVLQVWRRHSSGHPEVEENRPVYECRVCQDPATKWMLTKWAEQDGR